MAPSVKPRGSVIGKVLVFLAVGGGLLSTVAYLHRAKLQIDRQNAARAARVTPDADTTNVTQAAPIDAGSD